MKSLSLQAIVRRHLTDPIQQYQSHFFAQILLHFEHVFKMTFVFTLYLLFFPEHFLKYLKVHLVLRKICCLYVLIYQIIQVYLLSLRH